MTEIEGFEGEYCQSCGMPMDAKSDRGTNADGSPSEDYCTFCFAKGRFKEPEMTMDEMMFIFYNLLTEEMGMSEQAAEKMTEDVIPNLKRWKKE